MTPVVADVDEGLGLQVTRQTLRVGSLEHRRHQRRTEPLALPVGMGGKQLQVPVIFSRCVLCHQRADDRVAGEQLRRGRRERRVDAVRRLGSPGLDPHGQGGDVGGAPDLVVLDPSGHCSTQDFAARLEVLVVVGKNPAHHRVVCERLHRRDAELCEIGPSRTTNLHHRTVDLPPALRRSR